jgi:hypothetical protein
VDRLQRLFPAADILDDCGKAIPAPAGLEAVTDARDPACRERAAGSCWAEGQAEMTEAPRPAASKYVAKLSGSGGIKVGAEFPQLTDAMRWLNGPGLDSFSGKADRADIYLDDALVWTKANPTTPEREQADRAEVERMLAKLVADKS